MADKVKASLSIVMLSKNDELVIQRSLGRLFGWADEIIVVDDGSMDNTVEICKNSGANVIVHTMTKEGFAGQKTFGIEHAVGNWILQLDSDEVVTERLKDEITRVINNAGDTVAFSFIREEFFLGASMKSITEDIHVRLFKKGKARFTKSIHERLEVDGKVGSIDGKVEHYPYNSISRFIQKNDFYTSAEAKLIFDKQGIIAVKEIKYNLTFQPLKLFWKLYIRKKGYKDGMYGLVWCLLHTIRRVIIWAKYWELVKDKNSNKDV